MIDPGSCENGPIQRQRFGSSSDVKFGLPNREYGNIGATYTFTRSMVSLPLAASTAGGGAACPANGATPAPSFSSAVSDVDESYDFIELLYRINLCIDSLAEPCQRHSWPRDCKWRSSSSGRLEPRLSSYPLWHSKISFM